MHDWISNSFAADLGNNEFFTNKELVTARRVQHRSGACPAPGLRAAGDVVPSTNSIRNSVPHYDFHFHAIDESDVWLIPGPAPIVEEVLTGRRPPAHAARRLRNINRSGARAGSIACDPRSAPAVRHRLNYRRSALRPGHRPWSAADPGSADEPGSRPGNRA